MPDVLKKIVTLFEPDGTILREYKTVLFEGEGSPRDVEITEADRLSLYGVAVEASTAIRSEANAARIAAEGERDAALEQVAALQAQLAEQQAQ